MAGDWIKMRVDLVDDPAVIGMAKELGIDEFGVVGRLHKLWSWADKHCSVGHAKSVTFVWIDRYIGHSGFAQSMANEGWLVQTETGVEFPKFDRHNGKSAKTRAEATDRKRVERLAAQGETSSSGRSKEADDVANVSASLSQKMCDKSATREEKRREELTTTTPDGVVATSEAGGTVVTLPKSGKPDCPHQEIIALYHELLPQCPGIRDWTPARANQLRARWNEDKRRQDLAWWREFFAYVASCDFLVGRGSGRQPFFADLEWITKPNNFAKVREGRYENRGAA